LIDYHEFTLPNGLRVIHHEDNSTQLCVLNLLYDIGSKHEDSEKTGFAHLFEHLMFGGSVNIPHFDSPLQYAGGENNAFTNHDFTNYYITIPAPNIETAFWLESDRMLGLNINQNSLDVQKKVVIEEFKERYLNRPYGDVWLKTLDLAYDVHPYKWATIGKEISHIENAQLNDVTHFYQTYYTPSNAILCIAGNINLQNASALCHKWFAPIANKNSEKNIYNQEPKQLIAKELTHYAPVPADLLVKAYHCSSRTSSDYYATELLSDILGRKSGSLYQNLVKELKLFSDINCYLSGEIEPGLFVIEGKLAAEVDMDKAELALSNIIESVINEGCNLEELERVKNKTETSLRFNDIDVLNKAMKLCFAKLLNDMEMINQEHNRYGSVTQNNVDNIMRSILTKQNCSTLHYLSNKHG
jgi:zinc protease